MVSVGTVNNPANIFAFSVIITKRTKKKKCVIMNIIKHFINVIIPTQKRLTCRFMLSQINCES